MITAKFRKSDLRKVHKSLDDTVREIQRHGMKNALNKAAQIGLKEARNRVRVESTALKKSLVKRAKTYSEGVAYVIVGPNRKYQINYKGKRRRPVKYAHLVEFGHKGAPPRPFLRPAFETTKEKMKRKYAQEIGSSLKRVANRKKYR